MSPRRVCAKTESGSFRVEEPDSARTKKYFPGSSDITEFAGTTSFGTAAPWILGPNSGTNFASSRLRTTMRWNSIVIVAQIIYLNFYDIFLSLVCAIQSRILKFRENAKYQQVSSSDPSSTDSKLVESRTSHLGFTDLNDRCNRLKSKLCSILLDSERSESSLVRTNAEKYESIRSLSLASVSG
ncbi:hypothetical protein K0M31_010740 [Melipona bicolor]|uniref:Uncharacterized protein n=1 Tax=Melipona bicolor TaxID=60889 RepID=A0AA40FL97_9HYME|nr:hypothetical protein K0M31_010740 [Melipona bicolor]